MKNERILIINPFGIGDVLFSTPLIAALKEKSPWCYIGYICNIRTKEVLETNADVNEIFVFERDEYRTLWKSSKKRCINRFYYFWKGIKKRQFDLALDLSLGKEYALLCWLSGIKERRGFDYRGRCRFLTTKIPFDGFNDKPVAEYYLDLLGVQGPALNTVLIPDEADKKYIDDFLRREDIKEQDLLVGIAPGGGISFGEKEQDRRRWPLERFSALADMLITKSHARIILIWGPDEKGLARQIKESMNEDALLAPATTIREMAELCRRCRLVICSEGGPIHIASSQGTRTLSIFGPVDEKVYGPYPSGKNNVIISSDAQCRPCYKRFRIPECNKRICLEQVSVNDVFDMAGVLLQSRKA